MARATVAATARKTAARKTTTRKAAARKTATRSAPVAKRARKIEAAKPALSIEKVQGAVKEVAFVQLGIAGRVYDEFNSRVGKARKDAPKQWGALVKRGEQVQRDLEKARKELRRDLEARVDTTEVKNRIEQRIEKVRKAVTKLSQRVRKAA
jgi:hypothetical protein